MDEIELTGIEADLCSAAIALLRPSWRLRRAANLQEAVALLSEKLRALRPRRIEQAEGDR